MVKIRFLVSLLSAFSSLNVMSQEIKTSSVEYLQEKIYLHTDKAYYYPGEMIWFSGFINYKSQDLKGRLSNTMYVDLISAEAVIINSQIIKIESGRTQGNFKIPSGFSSGTFIIRAYTNWMKNYGIRSFSYTPIKVLNPYDVADQKKFADYTNYQDIKIAFDKASYQTRDKVKVTLSLSKTSDPVQVSLSVVVIDESQVSNVDECKNIMNDFAFDEKLPEDILTSFRHRIERGIDIEGTYFNKRNSREKTTLTIIQNNFENIYMVDTNDLGDFSLHDLSFYDSVRFAIQSKKGKVVMKSKEMLELPHQLPILNVPLAQAGNDQRRFHYDTGKVIHLKDVKIRASRLRPQPENKYQKPDFYINGKDIIGYPDLATVILLKTPGYNLLSQNMHTYLVWLRGDNQKRSGSSPLEPIVYLNDKKMLASEEGNTIGDQLSLLSPSIIDHIEVASTSNNEPGATGSIGVLYIYTKRGDLTDFKSLPLFWVTGFNKPDIFQPPDYRNSTKQVEAEDYRSTIYWDANINLSTKENTNELSFFTSDQSGRYVMIIEGVTDKGVPLRIVKSITVEN